MVVQYSSSFGGGSGFASPAPTPSLTGMPSPMGQPTPDGSLVGGSVLSHMQSHLQPAGVPPPTPTAMPGGAAAGAMPGQPQQSPWERHLAARDAQEAREAELREAGNRARTAAAGGGGGGGGGGTPTWLQTQQYRETQGAGSQAAQYLPQLVSAYNVAYGEAKAANEARYQEMLGVVDETTGQREADIRTSYGMQTSDEMQRLARLGTKYTSVAPTMKAGFKREEESALNRLADQMQGTRLGIMERKEDRYPDAGLLASLASTIMGVGTGGVAPAAKALSGLRLS